MKLIFCYWGNMMEDKFTEAFRRLGHEVIPFEREFVEKDYDTDYLKNLVSFVKSHEHVDFVLTINFIPIISRACKLLDIPYLSWLCDCPCYSLYSNTFGDPHNHTFFFDKVHADRFKNIYPHANIYYLPGACDPVRFANNVVFAEDYETYGCDVSFVGSLYSEKGTHQRISETLPPYLMGYVDGIIHAQLNVYGYNFMEESLDEQFIEEFKKHMEWQVPPDYLDDARSVIADYYFGYRSTMLDRIATLDAVSRQFNTDLYTTSDTSMLPHINNRGIADSNTMLPKIYKCSKVNLEIASKTFKSGMTLRLFEIMCAGGFLIANYQTEIPDYFTIDKDIVVYESIPDLLNKIDYYLTHDEERMEIAANGQKKVLGQHTYDVRVRQMLDAVMPFLA
ncbi:MAG: glycosyltransferase [Clostridium sp.]|nr:glycosyltransferase [Clostridium sp.]MCM1458808.1 glycosyltransferase [Bacteroides sp.]